MAQCRDVLLTRYLAPTMSRMTSKHRPSVAVTPITWTKSSPSDVHDNVGAQLAAEDSAFSGAADRGDHGGAERLAQLDAHGADPAGATMQQDGVTRAAAPS